MIDRLTGRPSGLKSWPGTNRTGLDRTGRSPVPVPSLVIYQSTQLYLFPFLEKELLEIFSDDYTIEIH